MISDKDIKVLMERVKTDGVVSVKVADGRVFLFSIKTLEDLVDAALEKGSEHVSVFIKNSLSIN